MSLFPSFTSDFAPLFRLVDDRVFNPHSSHHFPTSVSSTLKSFTPKFDVKESEQGYELHGEFPGVEQKDISIEWTDENTLTVRGRHEVVREEGERPSAAIEDSAAQKKIEGKQATVEDEGVETQTKSVQDEQQIAKQANGNGAVKKQEKGTRYWVSERSVGEFHRSFSFPQRVDQDAVKASLKNGILSILVPKAKAQTPRKVTIE